MLSSYQQQHLDKLEEVVGEEEFSGTAVEGVRRETKGLWESDEGGGRHLGAPTRCYSLL
jgi:hypothetical protein